MRWIVGLDLRPTGHGAINMARWMMQSAKESAKPHFIGVHVIPRPSRVAVRDDTIDELCGQAVDRARAAAEQMGAVDVFERIEAVPGNEPERTLTAAAQYYDADGIIIGRHGPRDHDSIVRLGRVARRLIRTLPVATMIVPPETEPKDIGAGPVIVSTNLESSSVAAARFGLMLSRDYTRDLVMMRVRPSAQRALAEWDAAFGEDADTAKDEPGAMDEWLQTYGLGGASAVEEFGDPVAAALRLGKSKDATVLVCGSRHLSMGQRVFVASTGTDLARDSKVPVLIVPPESITRAPG